MFVGPEPDAFSQIGFTQKKGADTPGEVLTALFYGPIVGLHGIETIVQAALLAQPEEIDWVIMGSGQEENIIARMLEQQRLPRFKLIPWVPHLELRSWVKSAEVCLGFFEATDKAARVIPKKVLQIVSASMPLITRDSPATRELFHEEQCGVWLAPPADPEALLDAIQRVRRKGCAHAATPSPAPEGQNLAFDLGWRVRRDNQTGRPVCARGLGGSEVVLRKLQGKRAAGRLASGADS